MKRRNTPSKQAVLEILLAAGGALSQEDIVQQVGETMDRVTVYRILNRFCDDGRLHRVLSDDGKTYFAVCRDCSGQHNHDHVHFRCLGCRKVECLDEMIAVDLPNGYRLEAAHSLLTGYCAACG
jgi:Fur family transcriptional regulator, ferric uptake regulator